MVLLGQCYSGLYLASRALCPNMYMNLVNKYANYVRNGLKVLVVPTNAVSEYVLRGMLWQTVPVRTSHLHCSALGSSKAEMR